MERGDYSLLIVTESRSLDRREDLDAYRPQGTEITHQPIYLKATTPGSRNIAVKALFS